MAEELMNFDLPADRSSIIKVIGVGGGGGNAVNHMCRQGIKDVDFVVCNTDAQALENSPVPVKIQLGAALTEGRGAGNKPAVGRQAALENIDDVTDALKSNTKMVFITAGMGGGTGTGAAPVIAKTAKEMGILTVAIVTIPFRNEGQRRINQALEGISEIREHVDSLLVINNEKIREIYGDLRVSQAFAQADNVLAIAAKGIAEIITVPGYINVDFADVETVMVNSGVAIMGSAISSGEDRAINAVKEALNSPLLNNNEIHGAKNILLNITSGEDEITMDEIGQITDFIQDATGEEADLIWGNGIDESLEDKLCVTIIATGFGMTTIPELYVKSKKPAEKIQLDDKDSDNPQNKVVTRGFPNEKQTIQEKLDKGQRIIEFDVNNDYAGEFVVKDATNEDNPSDKEKKLKAVKQSQMQIKEFGYSTFDEKSNIDELENQPAYLRKNVDLDDSKPSDDEDVSRYTLSEDENYNVKLNDNNSYLHDNVD